MLIHEVSKITGLTRKAIEYYTAQGLVSPETLDNGYRDYAPGDVDILRKIYVLRRLNLAIEQIRAVLADQTGQAVQAANVRTELDIQQAQKRQALLNRLCGGESYDEIRAALQSLEDHRAIIDLLIDAFPGYYGRYMALHFAPFLDSPIATEAQRAAYDEIVTFLDDAPPLPEDIRRWLDESTAQISGEQMADMSRSMRSMVEQPDEFAAQLERALPLADEFHASEIGQRIQTLKQLFSENGYYDVFIPALRRLSPAYDEYSRKLDALDARLIAKHGRT